MDDSGFGLHVQNKRPHWVPLVKVIHQPMQDAALTEYHYCHHNAKVVAWGDPACGGDNSGMERSSSLAAKQHWFLSGNVTRITPMLNDFPPVQERVQSEFLETWLCLLLLVGLATQHVVT